MITVLPSTLYHPTSGTSSRNFIPSSKAFSKALACAKLIVNVSNKLANRVELSMVFIGLVCTTIDKRIYILDVNDLWAGVKG